MKRLTTRERNIFIICVVLMAVYVGFNVVYKPLAQKARLMQAEIESKKERLTRDLRTIRRSKSVGDEYVVLKEKFKQDKPDEQVMSAMVSQIESIAGDLNLRISDLKPQKVKKQDFYNKFSVTLTIYSSFKDIMRFLYDLQKDPLLYSVDELRLDKGSRRKEETIKTRLILSKVLIP